MKVIFDELAGFSSFFIFIQFIDGSRWSVISHKCRSWRFRRTFAPHQLLGIAIFWKNRSNCADKPPTSGHMIIIKSTSVNVSIVNRSAQSICVSHKLRANCDSSNPIRCAYIFFKYGNHINIIKIFFSLTIWLNNRKYHIYFTRTGAFDWNAHSIGYATRLASGAYCVSNKLNIECWCWLGFRVHYIWIIDLKFRIRRIFDWTQGEESAIIQNTGARVWCQMCNWSEDIVIKFSWFFFLNFQYLLRLISEKNSFSHWNRTRRQSRIRRNPFERNVEQRKLLFIEFIAEILIA